jgi:hypothetical protein
MMQRTQAAFFVTALGLAAIAGCKSAPAPTPAAVTKLTAVSYPPRPIVPPPAFKLFHLEGSSITLVTKEDASDEQIEAILWQLHDAARTHSFDKLGIPQKVVDARDPKVWFHVYRGAKCASEKYASKLPCDAAYHGAGDYTLGTFANKDADAAELLHDENHWVELWDPNAPPMQ